MTDVIGSDDGVRLARVTYLPGVTPPTEPIAQDYTGEAMPDLPPKRLHNYPTGELERLTPEQLQQRMNDITARAEPQAASETQEIPETLGERSARAHNVSMAALTRRGVSVAEMTDLLLSRNLAPDDVANEVARLQQVGLLNDTEFAETFIRQLRERKGLGRSAITSELRRRKIDPVAIEEAMSASFDADGTDELSRARELAIKRAPQLRSLDPETARRRLGAFLMRKGYSGSIVASAVASALAPNHPAVRGPRFE
ncbi:MAG TPA: regulatory protein RecX [Galbitalea sp.]|jgi:regulatory protein|nr:regulatory protein RecX [Galbitalea sp.]